MQRYRETLDVATLIRVRCSAAYATVGELEFGQSVEIDASDTGGEVMKRKLLGKYRNMGLMIVIYPENILYVERPRPAHE